MALNLAYVSRRGDIYYYVVRVVTRRDCVSLIKNTIKSYTHKTQRDLWSLLNNHQEAFYTIIYSVLHQDQLQFYGL